MQLLLLEAEARQADTTAGSNYGAIPDQITVTAACERPEKNGGKTEVPPRGIRKNARGTTVAEEDSRFRPRPVSP